MSNGVGAGFSLCPMPAEAPSGILDSRAPASCGAKRSRFPVESLMSLAAFIAMMVILFAVPEPAKRLSKGGVAELRPAA